MKRLIYLLALFLFLSCTKEDNKTETNTTPTTFIIKGADMSYLPEIRASGVVLKNESNVSEDMLKTLKNSGVNLIRLRLWKKPTENTSSFNTVKNLSNEIKSMGLKVMITVHYSDTWADPSKQTKPAEWQNITYNQLKDSIYTYTKKIMLEINPEYIQIGNEINDGFVWPEGKFTNLTQTKELLQKGISAVRETNKNTKIILHYAGHDYANNFFTNLSSLDYDIIGLSYYPMWHGKDLDILKQNLITISTTQNKQIMIAETSYPFTLGWNDWTNNIVGLDNQLIPQYTATPQGQYDFLNKLKNILSEVPKSVGFCYWGSEWISYKGVQATNGSSYENQAFWDFNNKVLPVLGVY